MLDFNGVRVFVGDEVIFNEPGYTTLIRGTIVKFTPKGVRVKYLRRFNNSEQTTFVGEGQFVFSNRF